MFTWMMTPTTLCKLCKKIASEKLNFVKEVMFNIYYLFYIVMGPDQIFLTRGWVSHLWFGFEKFPLKIQIFCSSGQKVPRSASSLLRVKSILGLGQVRVHLYYSHCSYFLRVYHVSPNLSSPNLSLPTTFRPMPFCLIQVRLMYRFAYVSRAQPRRVRFTRVPHRVRYTGARRLG